MTPEHPEYPPFDGRVHKLVESGKGWMTLGGQRFLVWEGHFETSERCKRYSAEVIMAVPDPMADNGGYTKRTHISGMFIEVGPSTRFTLVADIDVVETDGVMSYVGTGRLCAEDMLVRIASIGPGDSIRLETIQEDLPYMKKKGWKPGTASMRIAIPKRERLGGAWLLFRYGLRLSPCGRIEPDIDNSQGGR